MMLLYSENFSQVDKLQDFIHVVFDNGLDFKI